MTDQFKKASLEYHQFPVPGKYNIVPSKDMATQRDLSMAYSPGVAEPCLAIEKDPLKALDYTNRGNLVAVVSNGTAVLGLGNIGALASKPVMEGKAVLFKKFAHVNAVDVEVDETDIDKFIEVVAALEPSYGGINLEDIKAPECFEIERRLKERMNIPVFHDDQHGTAIISSACLYNWARLTGRNIKDVKLVVSGAGAAALACLGMMVTLGVQKKNIIICDRKGVVHEGRAKDIDQYKKAYMAKTDARTLEDALQDADAFLGVSAAGALKAQWVKTMAKEPLIMALANPTPEIMPDEVATVRDDVYMATGRSDFPNQVNNVLCFPYIFRGALDVGATTINDEIKLACVKALADLTMKEVDDEVRSIYAGEALEFGRDYLIPKPFDKRLLIEIPMAVAKTAMKTGVATRPIDDFKAYEEKLGTLVHKSSLIMRPVYSMAKTALRKVVYAEGEDEDVLRAVKIVIDEGMARPILVGRKPVVETRIKKLGLNMKRERDFDLVDPEHDERYNEYWQAYHTIMERSGVTPEGARTVMRTNATVIGAMMVRRGLADAMLCGKVGSYNFHLRHVLDVIGLKPDHETAASMMTLISDKGNLFITDTHVNSQPTAIQVAETAIIAADKVRAFGIKPKVALLSHSNFGSHCDVEARKMREALEILREVAPDMEVDGEMHADAALCPIVREKQLPNSTLTGRANLLVCPCQSSASIAYNMFKILGDCIAVGPILLGVNKPVHIMTSATGTRGVLNLTALACAQINANQDCELPLE